MITVALFVRLHARKGKESELAALLKGALPLAEAENVTKSWYALQFDHATFGIFDSFENQEGMLEHRKGMIEATIKSKAADLLEQTPIIEEIAVIAAKRPGG